MVRKIKCWVKIWEARCYKHGIPDEAPLEINDKVPSYKKIAMAIMKNDTQLKTLGFSRRESKYYNALKRKELLERGIIKHSLQLKIFSYENIRIETLRRSNKS